MEFLKGVFSIEFELIMFSLEYVREFGMCSACNWY